MHWNLTEDWKKGDWYDYNWIKTWHHYINMSYYTESTLEKSTPEIPARYICSPPRITVQLLLLYTLTKGSSSCSFTDMSGDLSSSIWSPPPFWFSPNLSKAQAWQLKQLQSHSPSHGSVGLNSPVITVIYTSTYTPGPCIYQPLLAVLQLLLSLTHIYMCKLYPVQRL